MPRKPMDLTNQKFGRLTPIILTNKRLQSSAVWICLCDCGKTVEVSAKNLKDHKTKSCGCLYSKSDLIGKRYGKLVVTKKTEQRKNRKVLWECICDCGNKTIVQTDFLTCGRVSSCGCLKSSRGVLDIETLLKEHNINYVKEYCFSDFKLSTGGYPRFDFAIFIDGNLSHLIEYDGIQHFLANGGWSTEEHLKLTQLRDKEKDEYCKNNNIRLIRIKYNEDFTINDLLGGI